MEVSFNYTHFHIYKDIDTESDRDQITVLTSSIFEETSFDLLVDVFAQVGQGRVAVELEI